MTPQELQTLSTPDLERRLAAYYHAARQEDVEERLAIRRILMVRHDIRPAALAVRTGLQAGSVMFGEPHTTTNH